MKFLLSLVLFFTVSFSQGQCGIEKYKSMSEPAYLSGDLIYCPNITFQSETSDEIDLEKSRFSLQIIGGFLKSHANLFCELQIHSDFKIDEKENLKLTQSRAESIREYLLENFVLPTYQIQAKGYGFGEPLYTVKEIEDGDWNKETQEEMHQCNYRTLLRVI